MDRYLTPLATNKRRWEIPVGILSALFGVAAVQVWTEDSPAGEDFVIWLLAHVVVTGLMLWPIYRIVRWHLRQRSARRIAKALAGVREASVPLGELDRRLGVKNAERQIKDLLNRGFLKDVAFDGADLLLDNPVAQPDEPDEPEQAPGDVIREIRRLNDEIDDEAVSRRIDRLEQVTASILQTLEAHPDRADDARRFMNYYLPTTMKLLESYRLMEKQSYQGENIQASRRGIEAVLEKLVVAAERQQDKLFSAEALDVEAEISVLETMMASDGLTREGTSGGH